MVETIIVILAGLAALVVVAFPIHLGVWLTRGINFRLNPTRQAPNSSPVITHFVIAVLILLLAAIAIPNFLKSNCRGKGCIQSDAKTNLGAIYVAQLSYFSSSNTYAGGPDAFRLINWEPAGTNRYAYYCGQDLIPNKWTWKNGYLPMPNRDWPVDTKPASSQTGFTCMAVGNIDKDDTLDVWSINDGKILRNEVNDVQM